VHTLRAVESADDLRAMHDIRLATLFTPERHPGIVYDQNHPLDLDPANTRFLLWWDNRAIGVVRLDRRGSGEGVVRLVAIVPEVQRGGHGRALMGLVEDEARRRGMRKLMLNAHKSATGFYERLGWSNEVWDDDERTSMADHSVQMTKVLG